jgi:hypothetical protein
MIFDHWTYNQFYLHRTSWGTPQFTREEINWAIEQTEYKYFGNYEMTDQQQIAVEILIWCAREKLNEQ